MQDDAGDSTTPPDAALSSSVLSASAPEAAGAQHLRADQPKVQSRNQTRSHSHKEDHTNVQSALSGDAASQAAAADASAALNRSGAEAADEAATEDVAWGNDTGISELSGLGMTNRSASGRSGTRRRKVAASMPDRDESCQFSCKFRNQIAECFNAEFVTRDDLNCSLQLRVMHD